MLPLAYTKCCEHRSHQYFSEDGGMSSVCPWFFLSHNAIPADFNKGVVSCKPLTKQMPSSISK